MQLAGSEGGVPHRSGGRYYPLLEGLRAIAALAVTIVHFDRGLGGGTSPTTSHISGTAVAIFFALSGFLLYRPFSAALRHRATRPDLRRYYIRRAARILPAYWLAFAVTATVIGLSNVSGSNLLVYLTLMQDYSDGTRYHGIAPAWSLSIEATYYVLLPLGAALVAWLTSRAHLSPATTERVAILAAGVPRVS